MVSEHRELLTRKYLMPKKPHNVGELHIALTNMAIFPGPVSRDRDMKEEKEEELEGKRIERKEREIVSGIEYGAFCSWPH